MARKESTGSDIDEEVSSTRNDGEIERKAPKGHKSANDRRKALNAIDIKRAARHVGGRPA